MPAKRVVVDRCGTFLGPSGADWHKRRSRRGLGLRPTGGGGHATVGFAAFRPYAANFAALLRDEMGGARPPSDGCSLGWSRGRCRCSASSRRWLPSLQRGWCLPVTGLLVDRHRSARDAYDEVRQFHHYDSDPSRGSALNPVWTWAGAHHRTCASTRAAVPTSPVRSNRTGTQPSTRVEPAATSSVTAFQHSAAATHARRRSARCGPDHEDER
jgi:hypothetical protein